MSSELTTLANAPAGSPVQVYTGRVSYGGPDRLDITAKSAGPEGKAFAPTWNLLNWALRERKNLLQLVEPEYSRRRDVLWELYSARYMAEMRLSYRGHRERWQAVVDRSRVVLVCYCTDPATCHRTLVARALEKLGASYRGEVDDGFSTPQQLGLDFSEPFPTF